MKYAFFTLGCKVNQYETQAMEQLLCQRGHTLGSFEDVCDCYIINTCTVTAVADKKNRNIIRRCRRMNPAAIIGVCGCYAQIHPEEIQALGVDVVSGSGGREAFLDMMEQAVQERTQLFQVDDAMRRRSFEQLPAGGLPNRTRAMLKVQDGCCNFCTYCIIPYARGPIRSLPLQDAVAQARQLAANGYREMVVTGIEIASWGVEWKNGSCLTELLDALCSAVPELRVRLSSLEPRVVDEHFCTVLSRHKNLCPHFHLSLQSGSDTVLKRMHRRYDTARYLHSVHLLEHAFHGCALTTDLIVGFPGETEAELEESLAFLQRCGFAAVHVFPYSRRSGTPAAKMPDQIPRSVKEARSARAIAIAKTLSERYRQALVGTVQDVLFEQEEDGYFTGHTMNYTKAYVRGQALHNQVLPVTVQAPFRDGVLAVLA